MTRPKLAGDTETAADYNYAAFSFALKPIGMQRWLTDGPRPAETAPGFRLETQVTSACRLKTGYELQKRRV